MIEDLKTDFERAEYLQNLLISHATDGSSNEGDYSMLRRHFLDQPSTRDIVPRFVRTNRDLSQFWQFIKAKFAHKAGGQSPISWPPIAPACVLPFRA